MKHNSKMKNKPSNPQVRRFLDAWFAVRQFIQASNFNRFQGAGLSATQFMTLNLLPSGGEGIAMGELASAMNLRPATVAKTVDSLEARSLVTRIRNPADKRSVFVKATSEGMTLQNEAATQFHSQIESLFEAMSPIQRQGLVDGLEAFAQAATSLVPSLNDRLAQVPGGVAAVKRSARQAQRK